MEEAKEWIIGNWVAGLGGKVYGCPTCPVCREPTYSMDNCPFCNQILKEPKGE